MEDMSFSSQTDIILESFNDKDKQKFLDGFATEALKVKLLNMLRYKDNTFEDITKLKKKKFDCLETCYSNFNLQAQSISLEKQRLTKCSKKCTVPVEDLQIYFKTIKFLSLKKLTLCSEQCLDASTKDNGNIHECYFECFSRLERRYKGYWMKHRNKLISRYFPGLYE